MFDRIKSYIRDVRISLDFPRYESQCRVEHEKQACASFSTKQLSDERKKLLARIEISAAKKFDQSLYEIKDKKNKCKSEVEETKVLLSFFTRNYKQELEDLYGKKDSLLAKKSHLYDEKNEIRGLLSDAFEEKEDAYSDLNYYKAQIDSWYAKSDRSQWLFGNSGKKLPKHSLFGQSFGDLESYKDRRSFAYQRVSSAKEKIAKLKDRQRALSDEITGLKSEVGFLFGQIDQVKKDRSKMYELKKGGYGKIGLQSKFDGFLFELEELSENVCEIESLKNKYTDEQRSRLGVVELEARISQVEQKKILFLKSFDLEDGRQQRRRLHRELWLRNKGIV